MLNYTLPQIQRSFQNFAVPSRSRDIRLQSKKLVICYNFFLMRVKAFGVNGEYEQRIYASSENTERNLCAHGECVKRIYAYIEKTQRDS